MTLFAGNYSHNIDKNNRLFIPTKLRDNLDKSVYLYKPLNGDTCVYGYTPEDWNEVATMAIEGMPAGNDRTDLTRDLFDSIDPVELDQQGRITVKADFCAFANLEKEVLLVGVGRHFEIWNKATYEAMRAKRAAEKQAKQAKGEDTAIHLQF